VRFFEVMTVIQSALSSLQHLRGTRRRMQHEPCVNVSVSRNWHNIFQNLPTLTPASRLYTAYSYIDFVPLSLLPPQLFTSPTHPIDVAAADILAPANNYIIHLP
jgi:hypothetical protein